MLRLHEQDAQSFDGGCVAYLGEASEVYIEKTINDIECLYFQFPYTNVKADIIKENMIISHDGQGYVILKRTRETDGKDILRITAADIFSTYGNRKHIQNIPDMIGTPPSEVFEQIIEDTDFEAFTEDELNELGMTWVDSDGYLIDFFSTDKISVWEAVKSLIENCGMGEIYRDNYKAAIVKRIGKDNGVRLTLEKNLDGLTVQTDMENVITRLYPYGSDDMHIGSVNDDVQYIDSPNVDKYGILEGYKDYSDYTDPDKIKAHAEWEFDEDNEDRIDVPQITISGNLIDLSRLSEYGDIEKVSIGDTVHVYDNDHNVYHQRIIKMKYYPYEPKETEVEIGHMEQNFFSILYNLCHQSKVSKKSYTTGYQISARKLAGVLNTGRNNVQSDNELLKIADDLLTISDGDNIRIRLGNYNGEFVFIIYDKSKNEAVYLNEDGEAVFAGTIETMNDCIIQGMLRVGMAGNNTKGIEFYGDAYSDGAECYAKILPYVANNEDFRGINIEGGSLCVGGDLVATASEIKELTAQIEKLQKEIDALS
ncbi:MAG: phage tail protein [Oscillospiraceae bacterium]|nr:phage tail protein [Oscillospiraceae bacterium]